MPPSAACVATLNDVTPQTRLADVLARIAGLS
jgi:hypothetical protein